MIRKRTQNPRRETSKLASSGYALGESETPLDAPHSKGYSRYRGSWS